MKILTIVVTFNAMPWAERCFGSLVSSRQPTDVLVVDNGSTDGTPDFIARNFPEFRLVRREDNIGFGAANNIGLKLALEEAYDFVYLLNQDAWIFPDTLGKLVSAFAETAAEGTYGILSPVQNNAAGGMDARFEAKCGKKLKAASLGIAGEPERDTRVVEVKFAMAAHWMISRKAIETVGGFSPAFRHYGEDDNYIDRLHYHGLRCAVLPSAAAVHDRSSRRSSKESRMKLKCVAPVVKLSNPCACLPLRVIAGPLELLAMSVKNLSLLPLRRLPEFIGRYPELLRLRSESRRRGAFL